MVEGKFYIMYFLPKLKNKIKIKTWRLENILQSKFVVVFLKLKKKNLATFLKNKKICGQTFFLLGTLRVPHDQQKSQRDTAKHTGKNLKDSFFIHVLLSMPFLLPWLPFSFSTWRISHCLSNSASISMKAFLTRLIFSTAPERTNSSF